MLCNMLVCVAAAIAALAVSAVATGGHGAEADLGGRELDDAAEGGADQARLFIDFQEFSDARCSSNRRSGPTRERGYIALPVASAWLCVLACVHVSHLWLEAVIVRTPVRIAAPPAPPSPPTLCAVPCSGPLLSLG